MITVVSGHHPSTTFYAIETRKSVKKYCSLNSYNFYYDDEPAIETEKHHLHYKRCESLRKASEIYKDSIWYIWLDSDVYVNNYNLRIEECIDLSNPMLYHLFHERPWGCYPINTGVKFVHRDAIKYEKEIWSLRNTHPWTEFPFEQKTTYEYILPKIAGQYKIHDPYVLNCIIKAYPSMVPNALFVHMCAMTEDERNKYMSNIKVTLSDIVDNTRTDKNTIHSYLNLYESLLNYKKHTATSVLEIGIGDGIQGTIGNGGSIKLWYDYFPKAVIHAVDIIHHNMVWEGIKNKDRIILHTSTDAYNTNFTNSLKTKFDLILDDGPHTLESMRACIRLYSPLLKEDGTLIIEDVQKIEWLNILSNEVPDHLKQHIKAFDLRNIKGRYDDIVFTISSHVPKQD